MHGGTVTAHSEGPGTGATFEIRLPLTQAPQKTVPKPEVSACACRRILIVDDNEDAANSLASVLQLEGHTVRPVYAPEEALEEIGAFDPDVILLDIGLPRMDGYELAKRVRTSGSRARLVALTGYGQLQDVQKGREAGFQAHLVKPVDLEALTHELA
ncbi:MAG: response regulator [Steroidobacteraceae bacterium]|nr:response regulator [Steroidobacteraceae bacterium]